LELTSPSTAAGHRNFGGAVFGAARYTASVRLIRFAYVGDENLYTMANF
jgi:hypothetical protein